MDPVLQQGVRRRGGDPVVDASDEALLTVSEEVSARTELFGLRDGELLARFKSFWPRGMSSPPSMPWLGSLIDRTGAYLWAAEFSDVIRSFVPSDRARIDDFVAKSVLAESDRIREAKRRRCKRPNGPSTPPVELPDEGDCSGESDFWSCLSCPPGTGTHTWVWPDCQTQQDGPSCRPTEACPGSGPIQPEPAFRGDGSQVVE
jgi:hypothetical protein